MKKRNYAILTCIVLLGLMVLTAPAQAEPFAYITHLSSNNVLVIDTATNTVTATVPVGNVQNAVAVNPAGTRVYVTNINDSTVSVIDTASNAVITTVALPSLSSPFGVAV